jgi:hypothetical protein
MATKKQKREAGRIKRENEMAELKARGLAAQEAGRRSEAEERKRISEMAQRVNIRHQNAIDSIATSVQKQQIEREISELTDDPSLIVLVDSN